MINHYSKFIPKITIFVGFIPFIFCFSGCSQLLIIPINIGLVDINEALINATLNEKMNDIQFLLESGANINTKTENGYTPLHIAVYKNNIELVELLLSNGANTNLVSNSGETPLSIALGKGSYMIANLLVSYTSNVTSDYEVLINSQEMNAITIKQNSWSKLFQFPPLPDEITLKLGIGNPYGLFGINAEVGHGRFAGSFGFSSLENITTWAIGGRAYISKENTSVRPRLGIFYGVLDIYSPTNEDYEYSRRMAVIGYSFTVGVEYRSGIWSFDADLVFPYKLREFNDYNSYSLLPSFGVGINF